MGLTTYRIFRSTVFAANEKIQYGDPRPAPNASFAGLRRFYVKTIQKHLNTENQPKVSRQSRGTRDVQTVTHAMAGKGSFSIYANNADIFYHRNMEKDELSILDMCGTFWPERH